MFSFTGCIVALTTCEGMAFLPIAYSQESSEQNSEDARQTQLAERFYSVLLKNPRRGTALDRIYGHHVDFGTLDAFMKQLRSELENDKNDGARWLVLGLLESHRGEDGAAISAYEQARVLRPGDGMVAYYLSQSYLRMGESDKAVEQLRAAIDTSPARSDLMEFYQQLGRVLQQSQRTEEAIAVWKKFEEQFPDDSRVLEQIAAVLLEENDSAGALSRFERLVKLTKDEYKKAQYRMTIAELQIKSNQREQGIKELESVLADLNPSSWMHRDVRKRIEDVFLKTSDQEGLVRYYEEWLNKNPEDVEGMTRLAKFLSASGRVPEGAVWMEKAIKLAPKRSDLLKTYIDQLAEQQNFTEADAQYSKLVELAPENSDYVRDWGRLILRNKELPRSERVSKVTAVWNRMLVNREKDAVLQTQVADLFRQAELEDRAIELYRLAIQTAPQESQYKEYLGEYLHNLKRADEALATWASIAEGSNRSVENLTRQAEVYQNFGYSEKAIASIQEAIQGDPKDIALQMQCANYLSRAGKHAEALEFLKSAADLATNDDQKASVLKQRIEVLQAGMLLQDEIELQAKRSETESNFDNWYTLASYLESNRDLPAAAEAIEKAIELAPENVSGLTLLARIYEAGNNIGKAGETYRKLITLDRRSRDEYWMKIAQFEIDLGRADKALDAANQLILASPSNTDNYQFLSQVSFKLGLEKEGIDALRKAIRINPNEPSLLISLASTLSDRLEAREAIDLYWRAVEKSDELEDKTMIIQKLVPLYLQLGQFDQLIEKLTAEGKVEEKRREMTICLAQAYETAGESSNARITLEKLLSESAKDTNLLQQLSKLCASTGDLEQAIDYQRQLTIIAPGPETELVLANLLREAGDSDLALEIQVRNLKKEEDEIKLLKSLDSLLTSGQFEIVLEVASQKLSSEDQNWELKYREAIAFKELNLFPESTAAFQKILEQRAPNLQLSKALEEQIKRAELKAKSDANRGVLAAPPAPRPNEYSLVQEAARIRLIAELDPDAPRYYGGQNQANSWMPQSFGAARIAAIAWIAQMSSANDPNSQSIENLQSQLEDSLKRDSLNRQELLESLYLASLLGRADLNFQIIKRLAKDGSHLDKQQLLQSLIVRGGNPSPYRNYLDNSSRLESVTPLADADLDLVVDCFEQLLKSSKMENTVVNNANIIFSGGQAYVLVGNNYQPIDSFSAIFLTPHVVRELKLANRPEKANELFERFLASADSSAELLKGLMWMLESGSDDQMDNLFDRWLVAAKREIGEIQSKIGSSQNRHLLSYNSTDVINRWIGRLVAAGKYDKVIDILARSLDIAELEFQGTLELARQKNKKSPSLLTSNQGNQNFFSIQVYLGDTLQTQVVAMPYCLWELQPAQVQLIGQSYFALRSKDADEAIVKLLQSRISNADSKNGFPRNLALADLYMLSNDPMLAGEIRQEAIAKYAPDDPTFFPLSIETLVESGKWGEAIQLLDSISARDQNFFKQKEFAILQLAQLAGETERSLLAVKRLAGMRLSSTERQQLLPALRGLGRNEMADALESRFAPRDVSSNNALATQLASIDPTVNKATSEQLALRLLQSTKSPWASLSSNRSRTNSAPVLNPTGQGSEDSLRRNAIESLKKSGELALLMTKLDQKFENAPGSIQVLEQLVEFNQFLGEKEKTLNYIARFVEARPNVIGWRAKYAQMLGSDRKHSEACDQYLAILSKSPRFFNDNVEQVVREFSNAKRMDELIAFSKRANFTSFAQPYEISNLLQRIANLSEAKGLTKVLMEKLLKTSPEIARQVLYNPQVIKALGEEQVLALNKSTLIPQKTQKTVQPWSGLMEIQSFSSDGDITSQWSTMMKSLHKKELMQELIGDIDNAMKSFPNWRAGRCMKAILLHASGDTEQAKQILAEECEPENLKHYPQYTAWIVGKQIEKSKELRPQAIDMFRQATQSNSLGYAFGLPYLATANGALIKLLIEDGRKQEARDEIIKAFEAPTRDTYDPIYAYYRRLGDLQQMAKQLNSIGFQGDAALICIKAIQGPELKFDMQKYSGVNNEQIKQNCMSLLQTSLQQISNDSALRIADRVIPAPVVAHGNREECLFEFKMSAAPPMTSGELLSVQSFTLDWMLGLCSSAELQNAMLHRARSLAEKYPEQPSYLVILAALQSKTNAPDLEETIQKLDRYLSENPLPPLTKDDRTTASQRRQYEVRAALWMAATRLLENESDVEIGERFANASIAACNSLSLTEVASAIYYEWASLSLKRKDLQRTEDLWNKWMDSLATRPLARPAPSNPSAQSIRGGSALGQSGMLAGISLAKMAQPQANIDEVRLLLGVAKLCADADLMKSSMRAFQLAFKDGLPPPQNVELPTMISRGSVVTQTMNSSTTIMSSGLVPIGPATPAATAGVDLAPVFDLIQTWTNKGADPAEIYATLEPVIFPDKLPDVIRLFPNTTKGDAGREGMSNFFVRAAFRSGNQDRLKQKLQLYENKSNCSVEACSLLLLLGLESQDHELATYAMKRIQEVLSKKPNSQQLEAITLSIPAAAKLPALKTMAKEVLKTIHELRSKTRSNAFSSRLSDPVDRLLIDSSLDDMDGEAGFDFLKKILEEDKMKNSQFIKGVENPLYRDYLAAIDWLLSKGNIQQAMSLFADAEDMSSPGQLLNPELTPIFSKIVMTTRGLPALQRYELWENWNLRPVGSPRMIAVLQRPTYVPTLVKDSIDSELHPQENYTDFVLCSAVELIESAKACGKLDEVNQKVAALANSNLKDYALLQLLCSLEKDENPTLRAKLDAYFRNLSSTQKTRGGREASFSRAAAISVAWQALALGKSHAVDLELVRSIWKMQTPLPPPHFEQIIALSEANEQGIQVSKSFDSPLEYWEPSYGPNSIDSDFTALGLSSIWRPRDASVIQAASQPLDKLFFSLPLEGDFEVEMDFESSSTLPRNSSPGKLNFNGNPGVNPDLRDVVVVAAPTAASKKPADPQPPQDTAASRIRVHGDQVEIANGSISNAGIIKEARYRGSPWIELQGDNLRPHMFKNLRFRGQPQVASEVHCLASDLLRGWSSIPLTIATAAPPTLQPQTVITVDTQPALQSSLDGWSLRNNELVSVAAPGLPDRRRWTVYNRPLRNSETVTFEFFYDPDRPALSTTFGPLSLSVAQQGLECRWLRSPALPTGKSPSGFLHLKHASINLLESQKIELLPQSWNRGEWKLQDNQITLAINDVPVFQQSVNELGDRKVGFVHWGTHQTRVRNVVMRGKWAEIAASWSKSQWEDPSHLFRPNPTLEPQARQVSEWMLSTDVLDHEAKELLHRCRELDGENAYQALVRWVLPNEQHATIRMNYFYQLADTPAQSAQGMITRDRLRCPAMELIDYAAQLGKSEELMARLRSIPTSSVENVRAVDAMLTLLQLKNGNRESAIQSAAKVQNRLEETSLEAASQNGRISTLLVVLGLAKDEQLWPLGNQIANQVLKINSGANASTHGRNWSNLVAGELGTILEAQRLPTVRDENAAVNSNRPQWQQVPYFKDQHLVDGRRRSNWTVSKGSAMHSPGQTWSQLFFQSPLRGEFEVSGTKTTFHRHEMRISLGFFAVDPSYDLKQTQIFRLMHRSSSRPSTYSLEKWNNVSRFRISAKMNSIETFVDDVLVDSTSLEEELAPWLVLQADNPKFDGMISNLQIVGAPTIPKEINLLGKEHMMAWRSDYFGDWMDLSDNSSAPFIFKDNTLGGNRIQRLPSAESEFEENRSIVTYSRPMLEDGELEYETLYATGQLEFHPAIGYSAIQLKPDGAQLISLLPNGMQSDARMTNAPLATSGFVSNSPIPLKESEWNNIKLKLRGDELEIFVNDASAAKLKVLEPANERFFSLFRFRNLTGGSVRNVVWRGSWPDQLPPRDQQELAAPQSGYYRTSANAKATDLKAALSERPFVRGQDKPKVDAFQEAASGLRIELNSVDNPGELTIWESTNQTPPPKSVTCSYRALKTTIQKNETNSPRSDLSVTMHLNDRFETMIHWELMTKNEKGQQIQASMTQKDARGQRVASDHLAITEDGDSGQLRFLLQDGFVHCLAAANNSEEFTLINKIWVGPCQVKKVETHPYVSDEGGHASFELTSLTLE